MVRSTFALLVVAGTAAVMAGPAGPLRTVPVRAADAPVTFAKDILPILQKNCQSCHRPGQIAPMSLLTYHETRPWARSMKAKVESRQMPPWFADPQHGQFANDRSLSQTRHRRRSRSGRTPARRRAIRRMRRPPIEWPADGWQIKPDIIVRGPEFRVPAHTPKDVVEWIDVSSFRAASRRTRGSRRSRSSRACCRSRITSASRSSRTGRTRSTTCRTGSSRRATMKAPRSRQTRRRSPAPAAARRRRPSRRARTAAGGFNCYVPGARPTTIGRSTRAS